MNIQNCINVVFQKAETQEILLLQKWDRLIPHTFITFHTIGEDHDRACFVHASFEALVELIPIMRNVCVDKHLLVGRDSTT